MLKQKSRVPVTFHCPFYKWFMLHVYVIGLNAMQTFCSFSELMKELINPEYLEYDAL